MRTGEDGLLRGEKITKRRERGEGRLSDEIEACFEKAHLDHRDSEGEGCWSPPLTQP
jgi:hypothetical protein